MTFSFNLSDRRSLPDSLSQPLSFLKEAAETSCWSATMHGNPDDRRLLPDGILCIIKAVSAFSMEFVAQFLALTI
jgi:hypothetical protein